MNNQDKNKENKDKTKNIINNKIKSETISFTDNKKNNDKKQN